MKIISLRLFAAMCLLSTGVPVEAGIYLLYDEVTGSPTVILDDQSDDADIEDGYVSNRAHIWSRSPVINQRPVIGVTSLPQAFNPSLPSGRVFGNSMSIPSIIMFTPTATSSPELSHVLQGGHAWSSYQQGNNATGVGLVYSPSYGAHLSPSQRAARGNRSRAQAFRLDYYK